MPRLNNIVSLINTSCQSGEFASRRFQTSSWNGIADLQKTVTEQGEFYRPTIVSNEGDCKDLTPDDNYSLIVYHRVESLDYTTPPADDYGSAGTYVQETAKMRLVCFMDKNKLQLRQEDVIAAFHINIGNEFTPAQVNPLNILECQIDYDGTDLDPYSVWSKEFQGVDYPLAPQEIIFSITYTIISRFAKCFTLC